MNLVLEVVVKNSNNATERNGQWFDKIPKIKTQIPTVRNSKNQIPNSNPDVGSNTWKSVTVGICCLEFPAVGIWILLFGI